MSIEFSNDDADIRPRTLNRLGDTIGNNWTLILAIAVAAVLIAINIPRLFEFDFWGDECMSILYARETTLKILDNAVNTDAHPPLFNLMTSFITALFGTSPFVYHLVPFIPYVGMLIISITFIRKYFGLLSAIIFMLLATFMNSATYFIPEVRMYELAAFFVLASYASLYLVIKNGDKRSFVLFVVSTLGAAYTHYYGMMAVGLFFVGLFFYYVLRRDWKDFRYYLIASLITLLGYLPWVLASMIRAVERITNDFWIQEQMSIEDSFLYIFNDSRYLYAFIVLFSMIVLAMLFRIIWNKRKNEIDKISDDSRDLWWMGIGILSIVGSILIAQLMSSMSRPLVLERYLYPVSVVGWVVISAGLSRLTTKKYIHTAVSVLIIIIILVTCIPSFCDTVKEEEEKNESNAHIIDLTYEYLSEGDTIVTNINHLQQSMRYIYFPDLNLSYIDEDTKIVPEIKHDCRNLLFLTYEVQVVDIEDQVNAQGFEIELIERGFFAREYFVAIYELRPITD